MRLVHCAVALLAAGLSLDAQQPSSSLVLLATAGNYPGETYTEGPAAPAEFVFFEGEPIAIDVSIANWGRQAAVMRLANASGPWIRAEASIDEQTRVQAKLLEFTWRDSLEVGTRVQPSARMTIEPGDAIRRRLLLDGTGLVPGWHRVTAQADASDDTGGVIRRQRAEFVIELRPRSSALPAELARRVAEWLTAEGKFLEAQSATEALERVYPDSVAIHLIRSRIAEAVGDDTLARRELDVAAGFMRLDRDVLFRRFARPGQIEDLIDSLRP